MLEGSLILFLKAGLKLQEVKQFCLPVKTDEVKNSWQMAMLSPSFYIVNKHCKQ